MPRALIALLSPVLLAAAATAAADEKLLGIACRSVHLGYPAPEGLAFYNEAIIDRSAPGTYVMACGWDKGYFGLQELGNGKKVLIFSVWDSGQDDPKAVAEDRRVKVLHKDDAVRIGRFGGEGTGGQSFYDLDWTPGQAYRFLVTARPDGDERTAYSGHVFDPGRNAWVHLVTFSTITGGPRPLRGYYSFVEDFKRDRVSVTKARAARFGPGWVRAVDGRWAALDRARFTADANPDTRIDAGLEGGRFALETGGATENRRAKLRETIDRPADPAATPPADLPPIATGP